MTTETAELSHSSGFQASAAKSHHGRHHSRNKKGSDPFLQVSDDATRLSEPSTKHTISGENGGDQPPSLLADHRAMAKMELSDAFEMRGRVLLAIIAWMLLVLFGVAYSMKRVYAWMSVY
ncbi:hypothetical protein D0869_11784 [Hortaea werneckii]|uniref:Uncharacterized protein n=1 Tax=Hortaea werneckii TaxID=91943 RepID=A0A3M6W9M0_HORWE|nr:hypothetical protein D0869_11784 [Hortaea werneckii]